jgi:transcriptional regulator with XRE-family HTH domain
MKELSLGSRIRWGRSRNHLTQEDLAKMLGVTSQAVSQWERDETKPQIEKLPHIAFACGLGLEWLLGGGEFTEAEKTAIGELQANGLAVFQGFNPGDIRPLWEAWQRLSLNQRKVAIRMLKAMAEPESKE